MEAITQRRRDHEAQHARANDYTVPHEVRAKYLKTLAENGAGWVALPVAVALLAFGERLPGVAWLGRQSWGAWVIVLLFLWAIGATSAIYESARKSTLSRHSDKLLEVLYEEHQRSLFVGRLLNALLVAGGLCFLAWLFLR